MGRKYPLGSTWTGSEEQDKSLLKFFEQSPVAQAVQNFGDTAVEKAAVVVEQAKESVREPLRDVLTSVAGIAKKAIPTALSACASLQYTGGQASFASFLQPIHVRSKYLLIGTNRHTTIGYPLEKYRQLSNLSGFTQCQNVKLELIGDIEHYIHTPTLDEQNLIKDYLEAGFYIE